MNADAPARAPRGRVVVASTRAAAGEYADLSGPIALGALAALGLRVDAIEVVADGAAVGDALRRAVAAGVDVVLTSGGTGLNPTDQTPQLTSAIIDFEVPGIAERLRAASWDAVPSAALSRGIAGIAGRTLIVNLPGSAGGVRDGMQVLTPILLHALDQLRGGDHDRG